LRNQLLQLIAAQKLTVPIPASAGLDNARYQRCQIVQDLARSLNIELLFLPAYSPYYEDFTGFKAAIYECVTQAHIKHKKELSSLLTLNFQTFKSVSL
jgi:hypothetical protein